MSSNPIQKKTRNAALLGVAITLVIMGSIVALLFMKLRDMQKEQEEKELSYKLVYTLGQNVQSGEIITEDMLILSEAHADHIPNNATSNIEKFTNYSLVDSEGNKIYSDEIGTYIEKDSDYIEIYKEGNKYYTYIGDNQKEEVTGIRESDLKEDTYGNYLNKASEGKTRLYKEDSTDKYYILRVKYDTNAQGEPKREKEYVEILGMPLVAKFDMEKNTVLTLDMLSLGSLVTADVRKQEYNAVVLPVDLTTGDYIDIRVQFPNGQDYIVVSKKSVELPVVEGMESEKTIWVNLSEEEILTMSCAIVEAYRINGTKIYATKYTDPGMQEKAIPTYPVSAETIALIKADPNVAQRAEDELIARYTKAMVDIRNEYINKELQKEENSASNVPGKMNQSIVTTQEERKEYLQSLANSQY